jgi:MFS family permease
VLTFAGLVGLGLGLAYASIPNLLIAAVPPQVQASAAALAGVFQAVIPALAPIVVFSVLDGSYQAVLPAMITRMLNGAIVYTDAGFRVGFLIVAALALPGLLAALLLPRVIEPCTVAEIAGAEAGS